MEINQNENELHMYPINDTEFIGAINMNVPNTLNVVRLVILLDLNLIGAVKSSRFVKEILPLVISKLGYAEDFEIDLITFAKEATHHSLRATELKRLNIMNGEETCIAPAIEMLRVTLERMHRDNPSTPVRVLTISDGIVLDPDNAEKETKKLINFLASYTYELTINSQAFTLSSWNDQLNTKTLSYLLQINNNTTTNLCDIKDTASNQKISNAIVALFQFDSLEKYQTLQFEQSIALQSPWNYYSSMRILLVPGWNIFWLRLMTGWRIFWTTIHPAGTVKLGSDTIKVITEDNLTLDMFHKLMEKRVEYIADHMTILKVVGTTEANKTVNQISSYFKTKEDALARKYSTTNNEIITNLLDGIVKNQSNFGNYGEMAEFLRKTNTEIKTQRRQREEEARRKREEEERIKREEEERIKREEEERVRREEEELEHLTPEERAIRVKQNEYERIKQKEEEFLKREEDRVKLEEEEELVKRNEEERIKREEEERIKEEKEEEDRIKKEEEEDRIKKEEEEERNKREKEENLKDEVKERSKQEKHEEEKHFILERINREKMESQNSLVTIGTSRIHPEMDPNSIQTVFIVDEEVSGTRNSQVFTEKVMPLILSKVFCERSQSVHLVTFLSYKTTARDMLQSLLQTLDSKKRIQILVLSSGDVRERKNIESFAEALNECLNGSNHSFELQVLRLASTETSTKYKFFDTNIDKSNESHAKQISGQAYHKRSYDSSIQNYYFRFSLIIFGIIFALLTFRYILLFSKITNSCPN